MQRQTAIIIFSVLSVSSVANPPSRAEDPNQHAVMTPEQLPGLATVVFPQEFADLLDRDLSLEVEVQVAEQVLYQLFH